MNTTAYSHTSVHVAIHLTNDKQCRLEARRELDLPAMWLTDLQAVYLEGVIPAARYVAYGWEPFGDRPGSRPFTREYAATGSRDTWADARTNAIRDLGAELVTACDAAAAVQLSEHLHTLRETSRTNMVR